jgi:hypothetical protein
MEKECIKTKLLSLVIENQNFSGGMAAVNTAPTGGIVLKENNRSIMQRLLNQDLLTQQQLTIQNIMFPMMIKMVRDEVRNDKRDEENWQLKLDDKKKGVRVYNKLVEGSTWAALKGVITIPADPETVRDVLLHRCNTVNYDEMASTVHLLYQHNHTNQSQVPDPRHGKLQEKEKHARAGLVSGLEMRYARYKAIWPTAPRDFVVISGCVTLKEAIARGWTTNSDDSDLESLEKTFVVASRSCDSLLPLLPELDDDFGDQTEDHAEVVKTRERMARAVVRKECVRGGVLVSGYLIRPVLAAPTAIGRPSHHGRGELPSSQLQLEGAWTEVTLVAHTALNGSLPPALLNKLSAAAPAKLLWNVKQLVCDRAARTMQGHHCRRHTVACEQHWRDNSCSGGCEGIRLGFVASAAVHKSI